MTVIAKITRLPCGCETCNVNGRMVVFSWCAPHAPTFAPPGALTEGQIVEVLDERGWSFLRPVLPDGTLGRLVESAEIAQALAARGKR